MNVSKKLRYIFFCSLSNFSRYSLAVLLGVVFLPDWVGATRGGTELRIAQQPEATSQEAIRAAAKRATDEGWQLYKQGTAESLQQAIKKWKEALPLWRQLDDKAWEAAILTGIGSVYNALSDKQQALNYYNSSLPLWRQVEDERGEALVLNNIGKVYDALGDKQQALNYYNSSLPLKRQVDDKAGEALILANIGKVYDALGDKQQALNYYNSSLPLWRQLDDKAWEAAILTGIGSVYNALGDKQQALNYYNSSLPLWRQVENKRGEALVLNSIGNVYNDLDDKQQALNYYNSSLPLWRQVNDKAGEATILYNIGTLYDDLGDKQQALNYYNSSLPLWRQVEDKRGQATTLNNIGKVYDALGEKQQALNYYNSSLPLSQQVKDKAGESNTLNNIGTLYSDLGDKQQALKYYNSSLLLARQVGDKAGEATTLNNIGRFYSALGDKQQALNYYNSLLFLWRQVEDKRGEAGTLNNIGLNYNALGNNQQALNHLNQSLLLTRQVKDKAGEALTLNNIGTLYSDLGDKQQALNYYNSSLTLTRQVGDKALEAITLSNIALMERERGNLNSALTQIQVAINIIENLRTKVDSQDLRTSYFASVQGYYKFYIDLLMQLHKQNPSIGYNAQALHISERSRARSLLELLTEASADIRKSVDPKLLAIERSLQQKLDAKAKLRQQLPLNQQTRAPALKTEIDNLLNSYKQLQTKIRTTSPKYATLKYPQPLKLPQIQQQLDKDTLLLQYSLGKGRSYLWVVTPNSIQSYELPEQQLIEQAATNFISELQQQASTDLTAKYAHELSQLILAPVADKLGKKRLIIVADGALQNIPFAALTQPSKSADASNYQPLVVNHEIVSLPSMTTLAFQRQELIGRKRAPKTLAILADPVFAADDERVTGKPKGIAPELKLEDQLEQSALGRAARNLKRQGWERLAGTNEEAEAILKLVTSSNRLQAFDFDANYNWVTNEQLTQYRFLHFATHGFADPLNPELSGIVLSLVDKRGQPVPQGYLRLGDIFNLNLPAELIVLSACQTGVGKEVQGEGLVGLTRGLMYAGSARVAVSLWDVSDESTPLLMREFYRQMLQQGKSPAAALRAAQIYMWQQQDWQNPNYWAAFTMQGEWR